MHMQLGVHTTEKVIESRVFVELTTYIEQVVERSGETVFKLSEIHSLYTSRLKELGIQKQINKTRLKEKLLEHFVEAQAKQFDGRNIALIFRHGQHKKESIHSFRYHIKTFFGI